MSWRYWGGGLVATVLLLLSGSAAGQAGQAEGVEEYLVERMRANGAPGLAYALVHHDRVVGVGAWGVDGNGRPMTEHTPVGFGSVSKPVTATAVLRLAETGAVDLDDPVIRHLPWFRMADQGHADRITPRHLLEQTSGISAEDGYTPIRHRRQPAGRDPPLGREPGRRDADRGTRCAAPVQPGQRDDPGRDDRGGQRVVVRGVRGARGVRAVGNVRRA